MRVRAGSGIPRSQRKQCGGLLLRGLQRSGERGTVWRGEAEDGIEQGADFVVAGVRPRGGDRSVQRGGAVLCDVLACGGGKSGGLVEALPSERNQLHVFGQRRALLAQRGRDAFRSRDGSGQGRVERVRCSG